MNEISWNVDNIRALVSETKQLADHHRQKERTLEKIKRTTDTRVLHDPIGNGSVPIDEAIRRERAEAALLEKNATCLSDLAERILEPGRT